MPQEEGLLVRVEVVGQDSQRWMRRVRLGGRERASAATAGSPHGARHRVGEAARLNVTMMMTERTCRARQRVNGTCPRAMSSRQDLWWRA